jgi:hypothetical protein
MQITLTIELIYEFHGPRISGGCPDDEGERCQETKD